MPEDASLDDFLDAGSADSEGDAAAAPTDDDRADGTGTAGETDDSVDGDGPADEGDRPAADGDGPEPDDDGRVRPSTVDPATTTYEWTGEGAACEGCGRVVDRRWRDDAGLVCGSCKDW